MFDVQKKKKKSSFFRSEGEKTGVIVNECRYYQNYSDFHDRVSLLDKKGKKLQERKLLGKNTIREEISDYTFELSSLEFKI